MSKITVDRAVLEQALEALSLALSDVDWRANSPTQPYIYKSHCKLTEALAQPQQEPVAIVVATEYEDGSPAAHGIKESKCLQQF